MSQTQMLLSWDEYQKNICNGLSELQQHGDFVDMTLAADGHHVKVHQLVMSMASPYIRALITSVNCPHPVIFLNYIYTGEVLVDRNKLAEVITAGKALHIKGLRGMFEPNTPEAEDPSTVRTMSPLTKNVTEKLMQSRENEKKVEKQEESHPAQPIHKINIDENNTNKTPMADTQDSANSKQHKTRISQTTPEPFLHQQLHFSVSKQGCLQAIHRRHIYRLKYFDWRYRLRVWQCINNSGNLKCPGTLTTNEDQEVTSWSYKHNHSYHDNKIEHKLNNGKIFSDFCEADICSQITQRELFQSSIENNTYY